MSLDTNTGTCGSCGHCVVADWHGGIDATCRVLLSRGAIKLMGCDCICWCSIAEFAYYRGECDICGRIAEPHSLVFHETPGKRVMVCCPKCHITAHRPEWEGGLAELKDRYTSVELQHKASDWRPETKS